MSKAKKQFDFARYKRRHVALKILYFGWDYDGLAAQQDNANTIEFHLFQALKKTCLVESRDKCNYNRCGRTDKGVSSHGQVVNLDVRSNLIDEDDPQNVGLFTPVGYDVSTKQSEAGQLKEINYVDILNHVLPDHIKIIAWAPVNQDFSSRFSCQSRSYSYIFPLGDLSLNSMRKALQYMIGEHDFRNLCSFDLKNGVISHKRVIISAHIESVSPIGVDDTTTDNVSQYSFYQVVIVGQAFLYHQIRCIMTILFLIGTGKEHPETMRDLLDLSKCPGRPNYTKASPMPLCLFDCKYKPEDLPLGWFFNQEALQNIIRKLKHLWLQYRTKAQMIEKVLRDLDDTLPINEDPTLKRPRLEVNKWKDFGLEFDNMSDTKYILLLKRSQDDTLESKLKALDKKKNIVTETSSTKDNQ